MDIVNMKLLRKNLNVLVMVQPYHPRLKNFWYPVTFSTDLKDATMVDRCMARLQELQFTVGGTKVAEKSAYFISNGREWSTGRK